MRCSTSVGSWLAPAPASHLRHRTIISSGADSMPPPPYPTPPHPLPCMIKALPCSNLTRELMIRGYVHTACARQTDGVLVKHTNTHAMHMIMDGCRVTFSLTSFAVLCYLRCRGGYSNRLPRGRPANLQALPPGMRT